MDCITAPRFGRGAGIGREGIHVICGGENADVPEYLCFVHDVLGEPVFQIDILYFKIRGVIDGEVCKIIVVKIQPHARVIAIRVFRGPAFQRNVQHVRCPRGGKTELIGLCRPCLLRPVTECSLHAKGEAFPA